MTPISYRIDFAATGTAQLDPVLITENGFVQNIVVDASGLPGSVTVSVAITDTDGYDLFATGAITGGTKQTWGGYKAPEIGSLPLDYNYTVTATLSGAIGGTGGYIYVKFYCKSMGRGE